MAKNTLEKLKGKSENDLSKELIRERQKLQELRFDLARGKVKNSAAVRDARKKIAKISTLIGQIKKKESKEEEDG